MAPRQGGVLWLRASADAGPRSARHVAADPRPGPQGSRDPHGGGSSAAGVRRGAGALPAV